MLGGIGEKIVARLLSKSYTVEMSFDKYDSIKDMTASGKTVEVKTLMYNFSTKALWLDESQWRKCDAVDMLFMVKVPLYQSSLIEIYECVDRKKYGTATGAKNKICRVYRLTDLKLYSTISCMELAQRMYELSPSNYK